MTLRGWLASVSAAAALTAALAPAAAASAAVPAWTGTAMPGPPVAMVLLDVHKALGPAGIGAEVTAAEEYATALPSQVLVGLITFSNRWALTLPPTLNRGRVTASLGTVRAAGGSSTGLGAALAAAASAVDSRHAARDSRLLVLSDGARLAGSLPVPPLPTDAVTWHYKKYDNTAAVAAIVAASGGKLAGPGGVAKLADVFAAATPSPSPTTPRPSPTPTARRSTASATPSVAPVPVSTHPAGKAAGSKRELSLVMLLVFGCLLVLVVLLLGGISRQDQAGKLAEHIGVYGPKSTESGGRSAAAQGILDWVAGVLRSGGRDQTLAKQLDLAGIKVNPAEFVVLACCGCVALAALLTVLSGSPLGALAGLVLGALAMRFGVNFKVGRRRSRFSKQLPDVLQLAASSLSSGFSLAQALASITRENTQPAAEEFERALAQTRFGIELETALSELAERMNSTDMKWAVMAIRIQRTVGGNLAEVLSSTVATMRERATLRGQVKALSAEGRLSGLVLILMPLAIGGWLYISRRSYLEVLWSTTPGIVMLVGAVVMMVVGTIWMRKLVKIEV